MLHLGPARSSILSDNYHGEWMGCTTGNWQTSDGHIISDIRPRKPSDVILSLTVTNSRQTYNLFPTAIMDLLFM